MSQSTSAYFGKINRSASLRRQPSTRQQIKPGSPARRSTSRTAPRPHQGYLVWVSVVVVVTGPGCVVCCVVVVLRCVSSEAQPEMKAMTVMARQETISFFIRPD